MQSRSFLKLVLIISGLSCLQTGCFLWPQAGSEAIETIAPAIAESGIQPPSPPGNAYYHFVEALLERRRGRNVEALALLQQAIEADSDSAMLPREQALWLWQDGEADRARQTLEALVARRQDDVKALIMLGRLQQQSKLNDQARDSFERALRLESDIEDPYLLLGEIYLDEEQIDAAQQVYESLVLKFPESYVGHFYLGRIQNAKNNPQGAVPAFRRTIDLAPDLEEPRLELAETYTRLDQWEAAQQLYRGILDQDPEHLRARLGLGIVLQQMGEEQSSRALFKALARRCDTHPELLKTIFQQFWDREHLQVGLTVFEALEDHLAITTDHHYWLGLFHESLDSPEQAVDQFQAVDASSEYFEKAVVHAAYLLKEIGRIAEGIEYLEGVIRRISDNPEFFLYLAGLYEEREDYASALATLNNGLKVNEDNARLYFRLGVLADKLGRKAESISAMKTVITLEPRNATALNYLGYTYADLGENLDEAESYIREALKYQPDDGYITDSLGWVYYQRGQYDEALKLLLKASQLAPDDPIILEHVGDAYLKILDRENALIFYRRSLEKKPEQRESLKKKINSVLNNNG